MDKNAIKKFAVWARTELIERVKHRAAKYGITEDELGEFNAEIVNGNLLTETEKEQRNALIRRIKEIGYQQTMEEAAYTWFNRFSALRYMEVNGYLPTHVRVFTDEQNALKPQILTEAIHLDLDGLDMEKVYELKNADENDELYKYLLVTQCNAFSKVLPGMFTPIEDYTVLLFPDNLRRTGSVIEQMISLIPEEDWKDAVQIIGWLYQYYNSELKDDTFAKLKKNIKISKERIPAATQLFTPDWIVRYMVENSLGRIYIQYKLSALTFENESERIAKEKELAESFEWKYYLPEAEQTPEVREQLIKIQTSYEFDITKIRVIDPCMGSGHIIVYAFDVLMQMYRDCGWADRDAVISILENNLYGLDIDDRAGQLAYFSVMMKARSFNRRIFNGEITPNILALQPSPKLNMESLERFGELKDNATSLYNAFADAKEYGSLVEVPLTFSEIEELEVKLVEMDNMLDYASLSVIADTNEILSAFGLLIKQAKILVQKYDAVITNPPYMGGSGMSATLSEFVKKNYPDSKSDLFAVFIEKCTNITKNNAMCAMVTQQSWMFLESFKLLREKLISTKTISSMVHLGTGAFYGLVGAVTTAFVIVKNSYFSYKGTFSRLVEIDSELYKEKALLNKENMYYATSNAFINTPNMLIAYWISYEMLDNFRKGNLSCYAETKKGILSGCNEKYVRLWHEIDISKSEFLCKSHDEMIKCNKKWFPITSGGPKRKWYGNFSDVINLENDGFAITHSKGNFRLREKKYYCIPSCSWSEIGGNSFAVRYVPNGITFGNGGPVCFSKDYLEYITAFLNSTVALKYLYLLAPTVNFGPDQIKQLPLIFDKEKDSIVVDLSVSNIESSKKDWDSFETSWNFKKCPLI